MTTKIRIYELAKSLEISNKELMELLTNMNIEFKNHMSALEDRDVNLVFEYLIQEKEKENMQRRQTERTDDRREKPRIENRENKARDDFKRFDNQQNRNIDKDNKERKNQQNRRDNLDAKNRATKNNELRTEKEGYNKENRTFDNRRQEQFSRNQNLQTQKKQQQKDKSENIKEEKKIKPKKQFVIEDSRINEDIIVNKEELEKIDQEVEKELLEEEYLQEKHVRKGKKEKIKKESKEQKDLIKLQNQKNQEKKVEKVLIPESITVSELASRIQRPNSEVLKKLIMLGIMANINQEIDFDTASLIAEDFGIKVEKEIIKTEEEILIEDFEDPPESLQPRPPVVVVMGHVDHGKTSLLDAIRKTNVTEREAGGITQHIGASIVEINGRKITFLDTPGHEAFTAMRARGAQVTDIAILVVAADDGVMPQTIEAINHAKAANVSIIVAVNKIDKPEANPDRVKQQLSEYGLIPEEWGGDTVFVNVSAKKKMGIDHLLEMILLVADMLELKANPDRLAKGIVIEAKLDKGRGPVATILVQKGTLRVGNYVIAGKTWGKIRAMIDDKGNRIKEAGPSFAVEILGLEEVPEAGDELFCVKDEKTAKIIEQMRKDKVKEEKIISSSKVSLDELFERIQKGQLKELKIIIKADVQGSVEALKSSIEKLSNEEVNVKVIHAGVGAVTESDVILASASNAIIIGFNVRPEVGATQLAEREKVDIRLYRIIYEALNDIEAAMKGLLEPIYKEVVLGRAEVRQTFKASNIGTIAGCYVLDGKLVRTANARIIREGIVVFEGKLGSLKRFKEDVREVAAGYECGLTIEKFNDIKEGDIIEVFEMQKVER
ncbi:translation initiation factor IF-2 [Caldicellulosiruptoraceae bacterium PP1]